MTREPEPHYRNVREAIISANLQTGATLANEWVYKDEADLEVFRILDYESEDDGRRQIRTIWPISPAADGWRMGDPPPPWPLYRLTDIDPFQRIYLCQSERAVEAARSAGLVATTAAHGCYFLGKTDFTPLAGRDVVIQPDNDESGRIFVRKVTAILARLRPPAEVRAQHLPGLCDHGNICQFLLDRHPRSPALVGPEIDEMADRLPEYESPHRLPAPANSTNYTRLLGTTPGPTAWLWPARFALGKLHLFYSAASPILHPTTPPAHYSTATLRPHSTTLPIRYRLASSIDDDLTALTLDLAARVTTGAPWPDGSGNAPSGSVLLLNYLNNMSDIIRPQFERAGADLTRIFTASPAQMTPNGWAALKPIAALNRALDHLALTHPNDPVKLVLIDPASWYIWGISSVALTRLAALAAERRVAAVMAQPLQDQVRTLNRLLRAGPAMDAVLSAWLAAPDTADPDRRVLIPINDDPDTGPSPLAFRVIGTQIQWEPAPADLSLRDVLPAPRPRKRPGPPPAKLAFAVQWLRARLARGPAYPGNPITPNPGSLRQEAKAAGLSWDTLRRAFHDIGAVSLRCQMTGRYQWQLPGFGDHSDQDED